MGYMLAQDFTILVIREASLYQRGTNAVEYRPVVLGDHSQGLGVVRCLGESGTPADVVADHRISLSRASRHTARFFFAGRNARGQRRTRRAGRLW